LAAYVFSLEWYQVLAERAGDILNRLGYHNVDIHSGDGSQGLADMSPYDAIIVTAAAPAIPGPLCSQLHPQGGRMVLPVGNKERQSLQRVVRQGDSCHVEEIIQVKFVPLVGRYGFKGKSGDMGWEANV
jgi:protein-L-isoaspartate(D-aspartate) O-methyltransferase